MRKMISRIIEIYHQNDAVLFQSHPLTDEGRAHTGNEPGETWTPQFVPMEAAGAIPFKVGLAPHASTKIAIEPNIPAAFGG